MAVTGVMLACRHVWGGVRVLTVSYAAIAVVLLL